ncbi:methylated-DNA--[protein]-cysteine S-methyltransferase [Zooshikella marina]|uniref:Methylated-DNA--protein-cysteine methyltransferase n=1 Tax=Zooshikella ganghwensis TaxID=202772 RepID=A0A4P9VNH9_9GAMM|nr:methylated-DNA--[protein]-cysteine S-methyltransferase [Zooshikella ganghwensis]MBU2705309.1 methylated-DNA--[protein]-cysteine S-methyltransferase [Zooshikella ganghwensis]RDH44456.1 methylated-DNA--[protein]-cysteine S-methyltransferase [Zooshikella ganghwensis]
MQVTDPETVATYYQALIDRNPRFVGIFFVGVKTTSICCIATCRARKPKRENVVFYTTFKEALDAGYRPCKVCKPTENANEAPSQVKQAISLVRNNPKRKVTDWQLKQHQISPEGVRRWFKKHYGMTFHTFQRMYRINNALEELKSGKTATTTAYEAGYNSLSGFGYTYKKIIGQSPKNNNTMQNNVIVINRFTTPLGPMFVCATEQGVCLLEFVDRRMLETEFKDLQRLKKATIIAGENGYTQQAQREINEYFSGKRQTFDVKLDTPGTAFQQSVWQCLQTIPYGQTASYQQQAEKLNKPKAVRAVASANGHNRIAIIIPCHRVIGKDGKLVGYAGGLERKQWLLEHEQKFAAAQ